MGANNRPKTTITHSLSFDLDILDILDTVRQGGARGTSRTEYCMTALEQKFFRDGWLELKDGVAVRTEKLNALSRVVGKTTAAKRRGVDVEATRQFLQAPKKKRK